MTDDAPSQVITINGQDFDVAEATELIEAGQKTREYEQKYNTSLDKVWPDYTRATQEKARIEAELQEAKAQLTEFQSKKQVGTETPQDVAEAQEAARKLGIVLKDDFEKDGYIRKDDLPQLFQTYAEQQRAVDSVLAEADKLSSELNGSDGRPKFNKQAVMHYAAATGKGDLMEAYEEMFADDLKVWKDTQVASQQKRGLKTLEGGSDKAPKSPKINRDNMREALSESMWGTQE